MQWEDLTPEAELEQPPSAHERRQPTSWRNPESTWYRLPRRRMAQAAIRTCWRAVLLLMLLLVAGLISPLIAAPAVQSTIQQAGEINYLAADVKERQSQLLQELREAPYNPKELADPICSRNERAPPSRHTDTGRPG